MLFIDLFSEDGKFLYVLCELDDLISVFRYNNGEIERMIKKDSELPENFVYGRLKK